MIRIAIADDHKIFLEGLISIIDKKDNIECAGTAETGKDFLEIIENQPKSEPIDIAVLDINMPEIDGVDLCKLLREREDKIKVLFLSSYKERKYVRRAIKAGAHGYILKEKGQQELQIALEKISAGKKYFSESIMDIFIELIEGDEKKSDPYQLTPREMEVLRGIVDGLKTTEIAAKMFISESTVSSHRKNIHSKLNVSSIGQLIRLVREKKILEDL